MLEFSAFGVFGAHIQKADFGIIHSHQLFGIIASHIRKLQQILRRAFHVCATVDQHYAVLACRQNGSQCCPANTADPLHCKGGAGQKCAGAAGGYDRVAPAFFQKRQRNGHGRVLFPAGCRAGIILHGDDLARVHDLDVFVGSAGKVFFDLLFLTNKDQVNTQFILCPQSSFYDGFRCVVTAHGVNDDLQSRKPPSSVYRQASPMIFLRSQDFCFVCPSHGDPAV